MRRLVLLALLSCAACDPKDQPVPAATTTAAATGGASATPRPGPSSSAAPGSQYRDDEVPVEADFEEQAEKDVTADNYQDKLAELEKELGATAEPAVPAASASAPPPHDD